MVNVVKITLYLFASVLSLCMCFLYLHVSNVV